MSAENAGSIFAEVRIRLDKLNSDVAQVTAKIDGLERTVIGATDNMAKRGAANLNALTVASVAASAAIVASFRSLITQTSAYQDALSGVQAATRGTTADLDNLEKAAEASGDAFATSTTDALGAVEALAKAGVSTADIMAGALPGALTLAAAGSLKVSDAAEIAAATMTQFGLAGSQVTHIADLLAAGAGKAQGEVSDLSQALKQAGLVASQTGLSVDDTVGSLAAFASAGLLGSDAGTSFRTMLLRLTPQSQEAADEMKRLGINAFDAKGEFVGITAFAGQLQDRLKNLTTEQRNSALATIFGSDSIRAANVLYTQGQKGIQSWIEKVNDSGFAAETARIKLDNLAGDQKRLDAAVNDAASSIGTGLNPVLRGLTQFLTAAFDIVSKIPTPITSFAAGAIAVAAALVGLNAGLGLLGISLAALTGPLGLVVIGLSAFTAGAVTAAGAIRDLSVKNAKIEFEELGKATGVATDEMDAFVLRAKELSDTLKNMDSFAEKFDAKDFQQAAKDFGLTNAQLAHIVTNLSNIPPNIKLVAEGFKDAKLEADLFQKQQAKMFADMDDFYRKKFPNASKATITTLVTATAAVDGVSKAIAYQNYLESQGLITTEQALSAKISLRNAEIEKIEKAGESSGKLSAAEQDQVRKLRGFNAENQADLDRLVATREAAKKAVEEQASAEKAAHDQIDALMTTEIQKIEANRDALLRLAGSEAERGAIIADAQKKIDEIRTAAAEKQDKLVAESAKNQAQAIKTLTDLAFSSFSGLLSALDSLFKAMNQRQIDDLTARYDHERELIENNGMTKQAALEAQLASAQATLAAETDASKIAGDQQAVDDAKKQLKLFNLEKDFQKKKAQLEYQNALSSWEIQVALATGQVAQAILNAFSSTAAIPLIGPALAPAAGIAAGVIGGIQLAAVIAAQPKPPKLATGGIVLPQNGSSGRAVVMGDSGGADIAFGTSAMGEPLMQAFVDRVAAAAASQVVGALGGAGSKAVILNVDGKVLAQTTVDWVNSGQVRLEVRQR